MNATQTLSARQRLQKLQSYLWAQALLGVRDRRELGQLGSAYNIEQRLELPPELLGQLVLFVLQDVAA